MRGGKGRLLWLSAALILAVWLVYPGADRDQLAKAAPALHGSATQLIGTATALGRDPSFSYRFHIAPGTLADAARALPLERWNDADYVRRVLDRNGPLPWHRWWWHPRGEEAYVGSLGSYSVHLLYDRQSQRAYLYLQNN